MVEENCSVDELKEELDKFFKDLDELEEKLRKDGKEVMDSDDVEELKKLVQDLKL